MYQKLKFFKSRTQGKKGNKRVKESEANQFDINGDEPFEQILKHEIDHLFVMTQVLNSVVLKGDETYRTMQELAKLTND